MSLNNIIKYATNTPVNTNPAVMSSVINQSFKETKKEIIDETISVLGENGQVGYVEREIKLHNEITIAAGVERGNIGIKDPLITAGNLYAVTINGKRYEIIAGVANIGSEDKPYIGNLSFQGGADNGVPFLIYSASGGLKCYMYAVDPTTGDTSVPRTVKVELITETIKTIDPKFIPWNSAPGGGGLPIVELTTLPMPDGAQLTSDEWQQLYALNGMPCILLCTVYDGDTTIPFRVVASSFTYNTELHYMAVSNLGTLEITRNPNGIWKFYVHTEWGG